MGQYFLKGAFRKKRDIFEEKGIDNFPYAEADEISDNTSDD
ncbi:unnamed protein product [marine sediment metagenome]|uniref:Uncharacterized protein n=1 Tax=marine sediment metagenome TaxID=412755 RepID=X1IER7_9ZZZZ